MKKRTIDKLLVLLDESSRSEQTVQYLAGLPKLLDTEIHLLHVFSNVPESHYDLTREPASVYMGGRLKAWEKAQRQQSEKHMEECRKILLAADFRPQLIRIMINNRQRGIARDIVAASRDGYDAVVLRRRGMNRLAGLVMGSVACKLLNSVDHVPMIFAGRKPHNRRILIGIDPSEGAAAAVDFVGRMAGGLFDTVRLVSVLRDPSLLGTNPSDDNAPDNELEDSASAMETLFQQATDCLAAAGFDRKNIHQEVIGKAASRAGALAAAAERGDCATIVVGRKGVSRVSDFVIGRVSSKLIQVGRMHHVWIVN